jgi:hypothetical protein
MHRRLLTITIALAAVCVSSACATADPHHKQDHADGPWAFTYFKGRGETGMYLAVSADGLQWTPVNGGRAIFNAQIGGQQLMRDPCAVAGPDGRFHMVWTTGWGGREIGYAASDDLIHWRSAKTLPVMEHEPTAGNCWAPELFYDDIKGEFLIFWATTIPGRFPQTDGQGRQRNLDHRIYCTTTRDFETFTPTRLFYDHGFNVIDSTIEKVGDRYAMFLKDETDVPHTPTKTIHVAWADAPAGPWSKPGPAISARLWSEGPTAFKKGDRWIVLFDQYRDHNYGARSSADLKEWIDISDRIALPDGIRHGSVVPITTAQLEALLALN